ncbi:transposase-like protein [Candidatus Magnetobacterium bavaricum]|nr:transposase-like protein [Candidatus Magnetobacterium bavaricum]KJU84407.1 transposase-like protein [Candidatus Magnetobacterium bavaricum]KJU87513.1 transposase-like protein [Candidatus Magnetobacterium bavaricum]
MHQLHQTFTERLICLILDNCSIHKSKKVKNFLKKHLWVKLFYLASYSP